MEVEPIWERREDFLALNPAGDVPVLIEDDDKVVAGGRVILEYLEEFYGKAGPSRRTRRPRAPKRGGWSTGSPTSSIAR